MTTLVVRLLCNKKLQSEATTAWGVPPLATGKVTAGKLNTLFGWWAKRIDNAHGALGFGDASGLKEHFPPDAPGNSEVFTVPIPEMDAEAEVAAPGKEDAQLTERFPFRVGELVKINTRSSVCVPLEDNPAFMKDLGIGTQVTVVEFNNHAVWPKFKVKASVMHHGAPVDFCDWVNAMHLVIAKDTPKEDEAPGIPDAIVKGHSEDHNVVRVTDWESLLEEKGPGAQFNFLKARTLVSMELILGRMPTYKAKDLEIIHRDNKVGAKRTEVWTLRAFGPGELMFAPYTAEVKDRLYTHNLAVHVDVPASSVPGNPNRVVALDGRGKSHLSHPNAELHIPTATGCLFWAIGRTSDAKSANLSLEACGVSLPEVHVHVPGLPKKTMKINQKHWPQVYILTNKKAIPKLTKLLALDDKVVSRARDEDDKKRKAASDASGKPCAKKAT